MTARSVLAAMTTGARLTFSSRVTIGFVALTQLMLVLAMGSLWRTAAEVNGGDLVGYSAAALVWYIVATEAAYSGVLGRLIETIGDDIAAGAVTAEMLRPASIVGIRLATELGRGLARITIALPVGAAVATVLGAAPIDAGGLVLVIPALVLATMVNLAAQHAFAATAFWLRDARTAWFLYQKLVFVLGGMLIPLEVLPDWLADVARLLPFAAMAYVPGRLAAGFVEPGLLAVQVGWVLVLGAVAAAFFAAGERRLQAVGG
jgi:ABC-2 type transport system permease protein